MLTDSVCDVEDSSLTIASTFRFRLSVHFEAE
jgi:hypothetical protein